MAPLPLPALRPPSTGLRRAALRFAAPLLLAVAPVSSGAPAPALRPPSVPLVAHDPYFSIWSPADRLTDVATTHWTGKPQPLRGLVRIDGDCFRVLGPDPAGLPALPQVSLAVEPTRTVCVFGDARLELTLEFLTPALPDDLAVLARPLTYISWEARSRDGRPHAVQVYFDVGPEIAVNVPAQAVRPERVPLRGLQVLRVGSVDQLVLARQGDDIRIDWGHAYLAAADSPALQTRVAAGESARTRFAQDGRLPEQDASAA
ncbi:MAG: DUF5127 domain-containing protein, partial [Verrucomicrobia bacterium]|nr:DUF5127 domain-containing protein [Verrucomicrobiota bacterium]